MNIGHFRTKLEEERVRLEGQLKKIASPDADVPGEWNPKTPDLNPMISDANELSDTFEELDNEVGIEYQLEARLKEVMAGLDRIKRGVFGKCDIDGEDIPEARLEANPAARTCIKHARDISSGE